jgi:hypothetical protein
LQEGQFPEAREGFGKALALQQAVGDRVGEGATWNQLGLLAWDVGNRPQAIRYVGLSFLIIRGIAHRETELAHANLLEMREELNYTEQQVTELLQTTWDSYQEDQGKRLLQEILAEYRVQRPV